MKKLSILLCFFTMLIMSCSSSDDNDTTQENSLTGLWQYTSYSTFNPGTVLTGDEPLATYNHRCSTQLDYFEFEESSVKNVFNTTDCQQEISLGVFNKNGFILTMDFGNFDDEMDGTWEILKLTSNTLIITAPNPAPPSDPVELDVFEFTKL